MFSSQIRGVFPNVNGAMLGTFDYNEDGLNPFQKVSWQLQNTSVAWVIGVQKTPGSGAEMNVKYQLCGTTCEAQSISGNRPKIHRTGGTVVGTETLTAGTCTCYSQLSSTSPFDVTRVCVLPNQLPCKAYFGDGTTYEFWGHTALRTNDAGLAQFSCPQASCVSNAEIVLVVDESGSISTTEQQSMASFLTQVVNNNKLTGEFPANPNVGARFGVVKYARRTHQVLPLSNDRTTILNNVINRYYPGGDTFTHDAMALGRTTFSTARTGVPKIMIVITDGECDCTVAQLTTEAKTNTEAGIITIAIGIDGANPIELKAISTCTNGCDPLKWFFVTQFGSLSNLLQQLQGLTCSLNSNIKTCNCFGFCGCKQTCYCPSSCDDSNKCTEDNCAAASGQCFTTPVKCAGDQCNSGSCDPNTGCMLTDTSARCKDNSLCTGPDVCDKEKGCINPPVDCDDQNSCTEDSCSANGGCIHTSINCDKCYYNPTTNVNGCTPPSATCVKKDCGAPEPCKKKGCNPSDGVCLVEDVVCPALQNKCFTPYCNLTSGACDALAKNCDDGDACTVDSCDPLTGDCSHTPQVCDDHLACTIDTCNSATGCVYTPIDCAANSTACSIGVCNPVTGTCIAQAKDCLTELQTRGVPVGQCHDVVCSEVPRIGQTVVDGKILQDQQLPAGCYTRLIVAINQDSCKVDADGNNNCDYITQDACGVCNGDGKTCGVNVGLAAGLSVGAAVGISLGVLGAVAIAGSISSKKAYDFYMKRAANMNGANKSPLYDAANKSRVNPTYVA